MKAGVFILELFTLKLYPFPLQFPGETGRPWAHRIYPKKFDRHAWAIDWAYVNNILVISTSPKENITNTRLLKIYWKFYHQKLKIYRGKKYWYFSYFCSKT